MIRCIRLSVAIALALLGFTALIPAAHAASTWYVSPNGDNTNGTSWAHAWTDTANINWASISSGDTINLDGGTSTCATSPYDFGSSNNPGVNCGTKYSAFTVGKDGVTIQRSTDASHNGTVVIDGGRDTALPYCEQSTYSASAGASLGINLNGHTGVVVDGQTRSGIVVRGSQNGVQMGSGGSDTLRNMEIFDNGTFSNNSFGYSTDGNGVLLNGQNNVYDRLIVHDNGQDEFHSYGSASSEAGSTVENTWAGALRAHPSFSYEPFNDLQITGSDPGCQHADGIQIFAPATTMSGFTLDHDLLGPGVNQGFYPSDSGTGTLFNNVTISNTTFLDAASHNIEVDHSSSSAVTGWNLDHDTIFATQGGFEIPQASSGSPSSTMTNTLKQGGYVYTPNGSWTVSGNTWNLGDPLQGTGNTHADPGFTAAPTSADPSLSSLMSSTTTNLTPTASGGSPLHTWQSIFDRIDSLNGGGGSSAPVVTTDTASSVASTTATLNGHVNPENQSTTYQFDYGTTTSYGTSVPSPAGSAGSGGSSVAESYNLTGLTAGTTYHYRVEATNATGTTFGSDQTFTTTSGTCTISETTSPAAVHSSFGASTATTASFSPPAGSLVEVQLGTLQGAAGGVTTSVTDSGSHTWTAGPSKEGAHAPSGVWFYQAYFTSAPGSITVTGHQSGSNKGMLQVVVKVLTGAAATQTGAATGSYDSNTTSTTAQNRSLTTTTTGSMVYVSAGNGDASGSNLTAISGTSNIDVWDDTAHSGDIGATGKSSAATGTPGATSFGWTGSAADEFVWAAQEVLPATNC